MLARNSWNLPPEDLASTGRCSIWRSFKLVVDAVVRGMFGIPLDALRRPDPRTHRLLADSRRRKRTRQVCAARLALS
jgi:hypothetical protein